MCGRTRCGQVGRGETHAQGTGLGSARGRETGLGLGLRRVGWIRKRDRGARGSALRGGYPAVECVLVKLC